MHILFSTIVSSHCLQNGPMGRQETYPQSFTINDNTIHEMFTRRYAAIQERRLSVVYHLVLTFGQIWPALATNAIS